MLQHNIMMSYRTHSLFHYTKTFSSLIGILESGRIFPNYCLEDLSTSANPGFGLGIPQVCFCDIPVSRSQFLVDHYGEYAIAIDKQWGIKVGCNPVQYVANEAIIDHAIRSIARLQSLRKELSQYNKTQYSLRYKLRELLNAMDDEDARNYLLGFVKKYRGEWKGEPYCNYEENEWRSVVRDGEEGIRWMTKSEYLSWRGDPKTTSKPTPTKELKNHGVPFDVGDIRHIILHEDKEVLPFMDAVKELNDICGWEVEDKARDYLLTKVTSFERIASDY